MGRERAGGKETPSSEQAEIAAPSAPLWSLSRIQASSKHYTTFGCGMCRAMDWGVRHSVQESSKERARHRGAGQGLQGGGGD